MMEAKVVGNQQLLEMMQTLRDEVAQLGERIGRLEAVGGASPAQMATPATDSPSSARAASTELNEELLATIGAAVAAYLGVKARIRHIQLISSPSWAQHGRATIQASHAIQIHHG